MVRQPRIFISYSRADRLFIEQLVPLIKRVFPNYEIWWDNDLTGGEDWWERILSEIDASDLFIYLLSNDSLTSEYCQNEFREALRLRKLCVPVIIRFKTDMNNAPDELRSELSRRNWVDMSGGFQDANANAGLFRAINVQVGKIPTQPTAPLTLTPVSQPIVTAKKKAAPTRHNRTPLLIAIIGAIATIVAVLITIEPSLLGARQTTPTNAPPLTSPAAVIAAQPTILATLTASVTPTISAPTALPTVTSSVTVDFVIAAQTFDAQSIAAVKATSLVQTQFFIEGQTATATRWTKTPIPTLTPTVNSTADYDASLTQSAQTALAQEALYPTATVMHWTPTPIVTFTPITTPTPVQPTLTLSSSTKTPTPTTLPNSTLLPTPSPTLAPKVLRYQAAGEPSTIDPQSASYSDSVAYDHALFATLLRYDQNNQPAPYIAKQVPTVENGGISTDGKTYIYYLHNDWKWSDGKGVITAQDVVYAFQRLVNPNSASGYGSFLDGVLLNADTINNTDSAKVTQTLLNTLGVKAIDESTVQFSLVHSSGAFNHIAALWFSAPVRKDNVERPGLPAATAWTDPTYGVVVGSGPFILNKWDHNKELIFTRNLNYGGALAKLDEIDLPIISDSAVAYSGFKAGELDVANFLSPSEYVNIKADPLLSTQLVQDPTSCTYFLAFDTTRPPFNDLKVRQAFTYAVNRDQYIHDIVNDLGTKQLSLLPKDVIGSAFDPTLGQDQDFSTTKAKAALAASRYPNPATFPLVNFNFINSKSGTGQRRADFFKAQFQQVLGIKINENPMQSAAYTAALSNPTSKLAGMELSGWCSDYMNPSDWLYPIFGSYGKAGNANNVSGFSSIEFDQAAQVADAETESDSSRASLQVRPKTSSEQLCSCLYI